MCAGIGNEVRTVAFLIMTKLTIGFLRRGYSPTGGVEAYLKGLARGLLAEGHRPVLFGTDSWPVSEWPGGEILRCSGRTLSEYAVDSSRHRTESALQIDLTLSVEKVPGCDIYRTDEGLHAAWMDQREPYLNLFARIFQRISPKHREKLRLEREIFKADRTLRVISISEKISREIGEYYGYPASRVTLIRNGVPMQKKPDQEGREKARKALAIGDSDKIVLFVGTGWERKGLRFAIRAVEKLRNPAVKLLVAGKGPARKHRSPAVRFLGPTKDMGSLYAAADLMIVPSVFEPFSLAALESMGAGVPVITSRVVGVSEIMIQGVHGEILPDTSNIDAISEAIRRWLMLLEDPDKRASVCESCVALASQYTLERNLVETLSVIRELVEEKRGQVDR